MANVNAGMGSLLHVVLSLLLVAMGTSSFDMFLEQPEDTVVFSGDAARLPCRVRMDAFSLEDMHHLVAAWRKNDDLLLNSSSSSSSSSPSSSPSYSIQSTVSLKTTSDFAITGNRSNGEYDLEVASASVEDSGSYVCEMYVYFMVPIPGTKLLHNASVFVGATGSVSLTVLPDIKPTCSYYPRYYRGTSSPTYDEGTQVSFVCTANANGSSYELEWEIVGRNLTYSEPETTGMDEIQLVHNMTLQTADNGDILECTMRSRIYPNVSRKCALPTFSVVYKPIVKIVSVTNMSTVNEGDDVRLSCTVDSNPMETEIEWIVTPPQNIAFHGHGIEIHQASAPDHFINVTCLASNQVGISSTYLLVNLHPVYKPRVYISLITTSLSSQEGSGGLRLRCNIDAYPGAVTVHWTVEPSRYVRGEQIGRELHLRSTSPESVFVDVTCIAGNNVGNGSAHVSIYLPPGPSHLPSTAVPDSRTNPMLTNDSGGRNGTMTSPGSLVHFPEARTTAESPTGPLEGRSIRPSTFPVMGRSTFSPFRVVPSTGSSYHNSSSDPATTGQVTNETMDGFSNASYPNISYTPINSERAGSTNRSLFLGGVSAGVAALFVVLVVLAVGFSRYQINKSIRIGGTRVMYRPRDDALVLPLAQSAASIGEENLYACMKAGAARPVYPRATGQLGRSALQIVSHDNS